MALGKQFAGGTCSVVDVTDSDAPAHVAGPFSNETLADRWIEQDGPRYEAMKRQQKIIEEASGGSDESD